MLPRFAAGFLPALAAAAFLVALGTPAHAWTARFPPKYHITYVTVTPDGSIAVAGQNYRDRLSPPRLAVVSKTGAIVWQQDVAGGRVTSLTADPQGDLFFGASIGYGDDGRSSLYKLDGRTGEVLWQLPSLTTEYASVAVDGEGDVLVGATIEFGADKQSSVRKLDGRTGEEEWLTLLGSPGPYAQAPTVTLGPRGGIVASNWYNHGNISRLDPRSGGVVWTARADSPSGFDRAGNILTTDRRGHKIIKLDWRTGNTIWRVDLQRLLRRPPAFNSSVLLEITVSTTRRGSVLVTGGWRVSGDFEPYRSFAAELDSSGKLRWKIEPDTEEFIADSIQRGPADTVYLTASFREQSIIRRFSRAVPAAGWEQRAWCTGYDYIFAGLDVDRRGAYVSGRDCEGRLIARAYSHDGAALWKRELGEGSAQWQILARGNRLIVVAALPAGSGEAQWALLGLDARSGRDLPSE